MSVSVPAGLVGLRSVREISGRGVSKKCQNVVLSELVFSSVSLMVGGVETELMLWYYCGRSMKDCRL